MSKFFQARWVQLGAGAFYPRVEGTERAHDCESSNALLERARAQLRADQLRTERCQREDH